MIILGVYQGVCPAPGFSVKSFLHHFGIRHTVHWSAKIFKLKESQRKREMKWEWKKEHERERIRETREEWDRERIESKRAKEIGNEIVKERNREWKRERWVGEWFFNAWSCMLTSNGRKMSSNPQHLSQEFCRPQQRCWQDSLKPILSF